MGQDQIGSQSDFARLLEVFKAFRAGFHEVGALAAVFLLDDVPLDSADRFGDIEHTFPIDDIAFARDGRAAFALFVLRFDVHELAATGRRFPSGGTNTSLYFDESRKTIAKNIQMIASEFETTTIDVEGFRYNGLSLGTNRRER